MNLREDILYNFGLLSRRLSISDISDMNYWYLKNIGINLFEQNIKSYKFYYSLRHNLVKRYYEDCILDKILLSYDKNYINSLQLFIKETDARLLDLSVKHDRNEHTTMRFTIRIKQTNRSYEHLNKLFEKMGLNSHLELVQILNETISKDIDSTICPLFAIGLDNLELIPKRARLYFGFWPKEVMDSWGKNTLIHNKDKLLIKHLINKLGINLKIKDYIKKFQTIMEQNKFYLDFAGVDIDVYHKNYYKLYFRMTKSIDYKMFDEILQVNKNKNELNMLQKEFLSIDCVALKFTENEVVQCQIYYKYNEVKL